jgi:hypothetical protein
MSDPEQRYAAEIEAQRKRSHEAAAEELSRDYRAYLASLRGPEPVHDPDSLQLLRIYIREAYAKGRRLSQRDATVRSTLDELDRIAVDLGTEIEAPQPRLPLGRP